MADRENDVYAMVKAIIPFIIILYFGIHIDLNGRITELCVIVVEFPGRILIYILVRCKTIIGHMD
jgi:hypothetical protein